MRVDELDRPLRWISQVACSECGAGTDVPCRGDLEGRLDYHGERKATFAAAMGEKEGSGDGSP